MMESPSSTSVLAQNPAVACRVVEGCAIVLQPPVRQGASLLLTFNETGTCIWNMLDGRASVGAILQRLAALYPQTPREQQASETLALLEQLLAVGAVIPREQAAA